MEHCSSHWQFLAKNCCIFKCHRNLEWDEFPPDMETLVFSSDVVKLLLEYGAFVNQTDKAHYKTGLHVACEAQSVACVQYLLDAGADPNVQAEEGRTPLHIGEHGCYYMLMVVKYEKFAVMINTLA